MSGIKAEIQAAFKKARLEKDAPTKTVISMIKAEVLKEMKSGKGREDNDALWMEMVTGYAKRVRKTIAELEGLGERGAEALGEARFELEFCDQYLPKKLDEAATEELVRKVAAEQGVSDPKMMGKLMGALMKDHRDALDGDLTRKIVQRVLAD